MVVTPLFYSLEDSCPVPWPSTSEAQLHHHYPLQSQEDTDQNFVIRRYLETLWLPESFNPLHGLVASLRRVSHPQPGCPSQPHPLHSLLEPLLLSTRRASDKYRTDLVEILANGGGAGEQEEMMMWYVWEYEKAENEEGGVVDEDKWKKAWLERLERREAMIQVLLYMVKLSLPGLKPANEDKKKKRKKKSTKYEAPLEMDEERLENFMDKMAVWQLTAILEVSQPSSQVASSSQAGAEAERHWTQAFFEDVVEPLFKTQLPEQCALFRSKLYPESPFSDVEETDTESVMNGNTSRAGSRAPSVSRGSLSRVPSNALSTRPGLQRSRSRSLSVSLAQDEVSQRASFVAPKRTLSREVSMSRVFKERPKVQAKFKVPREEKKVVELGKPKGRRDTGTTLIEETPMKRRRGASAASDARFAWREWEERSQSHFVVPSPPPTSSSEPGDICIEDTPVAMRKRQAQDGPGAEEALSPLSPLPDDTPYPAAKMTRKTTKPGRGRKARTTGTSRTTRSLQTTLTRGLSSATLDEHADESYMDAFQSSNVTLLKEASDDVMLVSPSPAARTQTGGGGLLDRQLQTAEVEDIDMATPTKRRSRKK